LLAITLAGFAAGAALRQIALATRRQGWRGLVGRANGGMIVHLGVILVAVALVTSSAYTESTVLRLEVGDEVEWSGHSFELLEVFAERDARSEAVRADVRLDGGQAYAPAFTTYLQNGETLPTPSVRTGLTHDVYLTIAGTNVPTVGATEVSIEVFKKPLILWMWVGGLLMAAGTVLAAFPGTRRRNPTDPVSARIPAGPGAADGPDEAATSDGNDHADHDRDGGDDGNDDRRARPEVVAGE
jgi:cytochrome c-type biogenesis protein CcmF